MISTITETPMGISLDRFDTKTKANAGVAVELKDLRSGSPSGAFITLLGFESDVCTAFIDARAKSFLDHPDAPEKPANVRAAELLAECTTGWSGLDNPDGTPLEFSKAAAKKLYLDYPAIMNQVSEFMNKRENFYLV